VNADEARRIVAELGLADRVAQNVAAAPPIPQAVLPLIARLLREALGGQS
jgi:hypothetical protein